MRFIMFLNHSYKRHSPELETVFSNCSRATLHRTPVRAGLSRGLGGAEVLSLLEERPVVSGSSSRSRNPCPGQNAIEAEQRRFDRFFRATPSTDEALCWPLHAGNQPFARFAALFLPFWSQCTSWKPHCRTCHPDYRYEVLRQQHSHRVALFDL